MSVSIERRRELCEIPVTLEGERARIVGAKLRFPRVVQVRTGLGAEWSWEAVEHVVTTKGGRFQA